MITDEGYKNSPGSTVGNCTVEESIKFIAGSLNRAHSETEFVTTVIENMVQFCISVLVVF